MRIITCVAIFINLLNFSCMKKSSVYEYADGSANAYRLTTSSLEYIPVKKEESSTGMYSGGDPKNVTITQTQYESISELLESAMNNETIHIKDRIKTSGVIRITTDGTTKSCIIAPRCPEQVNIESALRKALGM